MVKVDKETDTRNKILAAARNVFLVKGMAGARMQDIADEAGMNKALLHYYFSSKEKLFEVIFLEEAGKFFPRINMIFESSLPLVEKIEKFVVEYIDEVQQNPYLPMFILNQINQDSDKFLGKILGRRNQPNPEHFLAQIEKEVKRGNIRPVNPVQLLINILSMCIFPFIAKPMIRKKIGLDEQQFHLLMEQRKKEVPQFIINAIKKQ